MMFHGARSPCARTGCSARARSRRASAGHDGLAAAGYITLAATLTRYIDRADQIITATIYPAICAIQNQRKALEELYLKSNRATLMWVLPYAAGIVLFAPDLVSFVLGDQWEPAVVLLEI